MNIELYKTSAEKGLRIKLETRAELIIELKHKLNNSPNDEQIKVRIKNLTAELEKLVEEFYSANPDSMFYGSFYKEMPVLTRKQKVAHEKSMEEEKLYLLKRAIRHGKHSASKQQTTEEEMV